MEEENSVENENKTNDAEGEKISDTKESTSYTKEENLNEHNEVKESIIQVAQSSDDTKLSTNVSNQEGDLLSTDVSNQEGDLLSADVSNQEGDLLSIDVSNQEGDLLSLNRQPGDGKHQMEETPVTVQNSGTASKDETIEEDDGTLTNFCQNSKKCILLWSA
jgi:hypothetical protein